MSVYEYVSAKLCIQNVGMQCKQWRSIISAGNIMAWCAVGFLPDTKGSKETRSYQKGKCHSPIFSTFLGHVLFVC